MHWFTEHIIHTSVRLTNIRGKHVSSTNYKINISSKRNPEYFYLFVTIMYWLDYVLCNSWRSDKYFVCCAGYHHQSSLLYNIKTYLQRDLTSCFVISRHMHINSDEVARKLNVNQTTQFNLHSNHSHTENWNIICQINHFCMTTVRHFSERAWYFHPKSTASLTLLALKQHVFNFLLLFF